MDVNQRFANLRISDFGTTKLKTLNFGDDTWILWQGIDSEFSDKPCCVHPETEVMTPSGPIKIKDLKANDKVIDVKGDVVTVLKNIKSVTAKNFINISAGSLWTNLPGKDLLIRPGHPILIKGREVLPEALIKKNKRVEAVQLDKSEHVWTLCTKERKFIMMNGVPVSTWSQQDWDRRVKNNKSMVFWEY